MATDNDIPPNDLPAEQAVLGTVLLEGRDALDRVAARLQPEDFYLDRYRTIFRRMLALRDAGQVVDPITLVAALREAGELEAVGGFVTVAVLETEASIRAHLDAYVGIVLDMSGKRQTLQILARAQVHARDGIPVGELASELSEGLTRIIERTEADRPLVVLAARLEAPAATHRIDTLLPAGMLALLSGKDKRGKTLLAQEMARAVLRGAKLFGHFAALNGPVIAAFLDDPLAITLARLDTLGIRDHAELFLVDPVRFAGDPFAFLAELERQAARVGAALVIIDALYLLAPTSRDAGNDAARMTPLMRRLDRLATTTGAATLVVAHDSKSGVDVAGSYVIRAMAKTILRLGLPRQEDELPTTDGPPQTKRRVLSVESKLVPASALMLELDGVGAWAYLGTPEQVRTQDVTTNIETYLKGIAEPVPEADIQEQVPGRRAAKVKGLRALVADGKVVRTGEGKPGHPYLYALVHDSGTGGSSKDREPESKADPSSGLGGEKSGTRSREPESPREPESKAGGDQGSSRAGEGWGEV